MGVKNFSSLYTMKKASALFELLETGKISPEEFYEDFRVQSKTNISNEEIQNAWNALLLNFPQERIEWLSSIKNKYNVFLFSNTNKIHQLAFTRIYAESFGAYTFDSHFKKTYYSHECGFRKPYPESFHRVLEEQSLLPGETLFIDDTLINIEGAVQAGMHVIHLQHPQTVLNLDL
jgi:putative hydrolase of the HAD superfamily